MTLPLTAADARSQRSWLSANLESLGGPEKVIEAAAEMPLDDLLPLDAQVQDGDTLRRLSPSCATCSARSYPQNAWVPWQPACTNTSCRTPTGLALLTFLSNTSYPTLAPDQVGC